MRYFVLCLLGLSLTTAAAADVVYLKNGDQITGEIIYDSTTRLVVDTDAAGEVSLDRRFVKKYKTDFEMKIVQAQEAEPIEAVEPEKIEVEWKRKITAGYVRQGGNDKDSSGHAEIFLNRKTDDDETTFKVNTKIQTENGSLDSRKFYGLARYANSFGDEKKWFQFVKLDGNQDTTTNVQYRLTPSYGFGYWVADEKDFKLRLESAFGYEYTKYDDGSSSEGELVLTPSAHLEKKWDNGLAYIHDITLYPSLEETGEFRLRSESALTGMITKQTNWKIAFIDDYDSDPRGGKKKNDWDLITGLEYNF